MYSQIIATGRFQKTERQFSLHLDQEKSNVEKSELVAANALLVCKEKTTKEKRNDVETSYIFTASNTLRKMQSSVDTGVKASRGKNSNDTVISSSKVPTVVPQLARKKSRIFEDLPKLFESSVPESQKDPGSMTVPDRQTTSLQFQEGLCFLYKSYINSK